MKIIFLDVDGVLNDRPTYGHGIPSQMHLDCLKKIVDATNAKIVLSSDWRYYDDTLRDITNSLATIGLEIFDMTVLSESFEIQREYEIKCWLEEHTDVDGYVILEDANPMTGKLKKHWIHTRFEKGLLPEHVEKAINILNNI